MASAAEVDVYYWDSPDEVVNPLPPQVRNIAPSSENVSYSNSESENKLKDFPSDYDRPYDNREKHRGRGRGSRNFSRQGSQNSYSKRSDESYSNHDSRGFNRDYNHRGEKNSYCKRADQSYSNSESENKFKDFSADDGRVPYDNSDKYRGRGRGSRNFSRQGSQNSYSKRSDESSANHDSRGFNNDYSHKEDKNSYFKRSDRSYSNRYDGHATNDYNTKGNQSTQSGESSTSYNDKANNRNYSRRGSQNSYSGRSHQSYSDRYDRGSSGDYKGRGNQNTYSGRSHQYDTAASNSYKENSKNDSQSYGKINSANSCDSSLAPNNKPEEEEFTPIPWAELDKFHEKYIEEKFGHLAPVVKCTYNECKSVSAMTPQQVAAFRKQKGSITVTNMDDSPATDSPNPVTNFRDAFGHSPDIMEVIKNAGFDEPTPIQCQLWPLIMSGYDVVGIAQTGSGKTLGFLLPGFLHIEAQEYFRQPERKGPLCLIMAPTRELAQQIHIECTKFKYKGIRSVCIYGQGSYKEQIRVLEGGVEIVVCTPGRLYDFISKGIVDMKGVSYLVLDEADRMLDMGFLPDISKITSGLRPDKQVVLTSATWAADVQWVAKRLFHDRALRVIIGDLDLAAVETVTQRVYILEVSEVEEKFKMATEMLRDLAPNDKVLVFFNRKSLVDTFTCHLLEHGIDSRIMHGGLEQEDREQSLSDLKDGSCQILIATDVASRGLDVYDLTLVMNIDLPRNLEEYVHRCGRTGRAGKKGEVVTFVTYEDRHKAQELIEILTRTNQEVPRQLERLAHKSRIQQENKPQRGRPRQSYGNQWS